MRGLAVQQQQYTKVSLVKKKIRIFWRKKGQENKTLSEKGQVRKSNKTRQKKTREEIDKWN